MHGRGWTDQPVVDAAGRVVAARMRAVHLAGGGTCLRIHRCAESVKEWWGVMRRGWGRPRTTIPLRAQRSTIRCVTSSHCTTLNLTKGLCAVEGGGCQA